MKDREHTLVPKLRFPEFKKSGKWESNPISVIAIFFKGRGITKADVVNCGLTPCIRYAELYTIYGEIITEIQSHTNIPISELVLSQAEDVILPASGETRADIARASCVVSEGVALGGDINILRSDLNGPFFSYILNSPLRYKIARVAQGDTIAHLYPNQVSKVVITYPGITEQQKIADCLSSLDDLITAENRKLDALKVYKKGLMQVLFPKRGQTQPRMRFPEFRDKGEWVEKRLDEVLSPIVRKQKKPNEAYTGLGLRSHGKGTFLKKLSDPDKNSMEYLFEVKCNDLVVNITFAWEGAIAIASIGDDGSLVSHRFPTYTFDKGNAIPDFFRYIILDKQFTYNLGVISPGGAGRNRVLDKNAFLKLNVLLPRTEEQRSIADCLATLDYKITAQAAKINALKQHKRGLMQQLFPVPEEIET